MVLTMCHTTQSSDPCGLVAHVSLHALQFNGHLRCRVRVFERLLAHPLGTLLISAARLPPGQPPSCRARAQARGASEEQKRCEKGERVEQGDKDQGAEERRETRKEYDRGEEEH